MSLKVLGVIPARGGSKGVPRKNIKLLGDKPLIYYTILAAQESHISDLVVSTEDDEIAAISKQFGARVILRPPELSKDDTPTLPVIEHVLELLKSEGKEYDAVYTLQVTTPFRTSEDINNSIELLDTCDADSIIGVVPVGDAHPARIKKITDGVLSDFAPEIEGSRRQDLEPAYLRNGAVYLTRIETVKKGSLRGQKQKPYIMPKERSVNIDDPLDFALAETILRQSR